MDTVLWAVLGIVCGFGVLGNVTSLVIFLRQSNKQSVSYWLIALTLVDLAGLSCSPLFVYSWPCTLSDGNNCTTDAHLYDVSLTVRQVICSMHALLIVGMCTDRYIAVTKPEYCRVWLSKTKATAAITLVVILCVSVHLPAYAIGTPRAYRREYQLKGTTETPSRNTVSSAEYFSYPPTRALSDVNCSSGREHVVYEWVYVFGIRYLAMFLLPVLAVAVFLFLLLAHSLASKRTLSR